MLNDYKLGKLIYWIEERETVRRKKERQDLHPWTDDEILLKYKFCNVCRRDDRVSEWLITNVYERYKRNPNLWFMAVIARFVNWPPTIQAMMDSGVWPETSYDAEAVGAIIDQRVAANEKAWTGAYIITARAMPENQTKGEFIAKTSFQSVYDASEKFQTFFEKARRTVEEAVQLFDGFPNFGPFMAGQIVADWTYTPLLNNATDLYTWAPMGPGSEKGINWLFDRPMTESISQSQFIEELEQVMRRVDAELSWTRGTLTAHDYQNCLCELSKYVRVENGGTMRAFYTPETRF